MVLENNQTLFPCKDRRIYFPELGGFILNVLNSMPSLDNALCVYAGNHCDADGVLRFVENQTVAKYRFATSAILFLTPERMTPFTVPTVPILRGDMVIVGPRSESRKRKNVFKTMFSPFDDNATSFVITILFGFLAVWAIGTSISIWPLEWKNFVRHFVGEHDIENAPDGDGFNKRRDEIRLSIKMWTKTFSLAFKVLLGIFIIFYELVAFDWIFAERSREVIIDLQSLNERQLSEYIVPGGGAPELEFRRHSKYSGRKRHFLH